MLSLNTPADLQRLVDEGLGESLVLDYKASPALSKDDKKRDELCKDVSAFANSAGGQIIYGIEERDQKPTKVDVGSDPTVITREWIEQVLNSRITPRIDGLKIAPIQLATGAAYVISIPQANARAPHQAPDHKYYRRYNFQSIPMADYEVRDMMRRATTPDLYVSLSFLTGSQHTLDFGDLGEKPSSKPFNLIAYIENRSAQPAFHAVVDIGVVTAIKPISHGGYSKIPEADNDRRVPMNWFQWSLVSPPGLPIFRELKLLMTNNVIMLSIDKRELGSQMIFDLTVKISAPGFSSTEHWAIVSRGPSMTLRPPGSLWAADRNPPSS
jgi:hypothetical protein